MGTCSHQKRMGDEVQSETRTRATDQHVVQLPRESIGTRISQRTGDPEENALSINLKYNDLTDVMFVDLLPLEENSRVVVIDIGDQLGFGGQLQVRVDLENQIFYGLTIQNYSGFRRKLLWKYGMWSMQNALRLLVTTLMAGLSLDRHSNHQAMSY